MSKKKIATKTKAVRLYLEEADHADLRVMAAEKRMPMSKFTRDLVRQGIEDWRKNPRKNHKQC